MTIREFLNNGAEIQCNIIVKKWSEEKQTYKKENIILDEFCNVFPDWTSEYMDEEITFIYVIDNAMILEILEEYSCLTCV